MFSTILHHFSRGMQILAALASSRRSEVQTQ